MTKSLAGITLLLGISACAPHEDSRSAADAHAVEQSGRPEAHTKEEQSLLQAVAQLAEKSSFKKENLTIEAGQEYLAASGATCRRIQISGSSENDGARVACRDDAGWFFARAIHGRMDEAEP